MDVVALRQRIGQEAARLRSRLRALHSERRRARDNWAIAQAALARYASTQNRLRDESEVFSDLRTFAGRLAGNRRAQPRSGETIG